jgi:hypothetical protein
MSLIPKINNTLAAHNPAIFGTFESVLKTDVVNDRTNAELTITLRIDLQQRNPHENLPPHVQLLTPGARPHVVTIPRAAPATEKIQDANHDPNLLFAIRQWEANDWRAFVRAFLGYRAFWHGKFWLQTPDTYGELDWPKGRPTHRPNIYCRFELELTNKATDVHTQVKVVRLDRKHGDSGTFRSDDEQYDNFDVIGRWEYEKHHHHWHKYFHRTIAHELGHALGMGEIGHVLNVAQCVAAPVGSPAYDAFCYGTNPKQWNNIMGSGSAISEANAQPWLERIAAHTATPKWLWKASLHHIYPKPL